MIRPLRSRSPEFVPSNLCANFTSGEATRWGVGLGIGLLGVGACFLAGFDLGAIFLAARWMGDNGGRRAKLSKLLPGEKDFLPGERVDANHAFRLFIFGILSLLELLELGDLSADPSIFSRLFVEEAALILLLDNIILITRSHYLCKDD
ncbi:hypothetical protein AR158_c254L [Paramecium bursaria Chlorella virus AR158]|uniref:hypothetical protein n=1 Tax=Paramecium bursaria Chlorella virus AR158 TaxID=380598 RepID=UPI00015AA8B2|nr:hypothetical protein AR158_c254L [Paramecium bursaria Chlorella virus AR158]ABU43799.1 hypothetical protein AR158_c254L [Paramecium bursaria Chlorella virus AR158]